MNGPSVPAVASPITTAGVARRLGIAEGTVRAWVKAGRLTPILVTETRINLFDAQVVDRLAQERRGERR
jgi:predicted site-specific integrase-resolvase